MSDEHEASNFGVVSSVRGSVVDAQFPGLLPSVFSILRCGTNEAIVVEVMEQIDEHRVRGIALTATQGLARGMAVRDTGKPLQAPVGKTIISRMFDVFGHAIDRQAEPTETEWRSVHRSPPSMSDRLTKSEIFQTGIKAIDVLVPLERGGKAGLFRRSGGRQDRAADRDDPQYDRPPKGDEHLLRHWRALSRRGRAL